MILWDYFVMLLTPLSPIILLFSRISASATISNWMKALWWKLGYVPIYEYSRILLDIIALTCSPVVFGSILVLWAILPLDPGTSGSIMGGLTLLDWTSGWTIVWPLPQNLCANLIIAHPIWKRNSRSKVKWLDYCSNPSTERLAWSKRWPVQAKYQLLLRVLARVNLALGPAFCLTQEYHPFPIFSLGTFLLHPSPQSYLSCSLLLIVDLSFCATGIFTN